MTAPFTPGVIDLAKQLGEAGDRLSESVHETLLIADQMRARMSENQRKYWLARDNERMFR